MRARRLRAHAVRLGLWLGLTLVAAAVAAAQETVASRLIAQARRHIEDINPDTAAALLRQALDPQAGATLAEKQRAFVLFGVTELTAGRTDGARRAFREALALEQTLRVDTLAELHEELVITFEAERAAMAAVAGAARGILEVRGLPSGARLLVDGVLWNDRRRQVVAGSHRVDVTARGYLAFADSIKVDPAATVIRDVALVRSDLARLSVSREPWGIVYLDSERVGETPVFEQRVPAGTYTLRVESPSAAPTFEQTVELAPGKLTRLGTVGAVAPPEASLPPLARADSFYRALELDSALVSYRTIVWDSAAGHDAALRARAATRAAMALVAMSMGRKESALADSARVYFAVAYRTEPRFEPDSGDAGPELRAVMAAARARALGIAVNAPSDTLLPPTGGLLVIAVQPTHPALVRLRILRGDATGPAVRVDSQVTGAEARFTWDYHLADGSLLAPGGYTLVVAARDPQGEISPVVERSLQVDLEVVDTLPHPMPPPATAFAPETLRLKRAPAAVLLAGAMLGAGTLGLERALGNSGLTQGGATGAGSYLVAGSVSLVAVAGFLGGHRTRPVTENILRNAELRQRYARDREAALAENVRRRSDARIHIRFGPERR
jgi:hypothetical protein